MKVAKIALIILICLGCLGGLYLGFVFFILSGFIFAGDIDLTAEQRNAAQIWVYGGKFFGLVLMFGSLIVMFLSEGISKLILKLFGANADE